MQVAAFAVVLCLIAVLGAIFVRREPSYDGRSASNWFEQAESVKGGQQPEALKPVAEAFVKMGPDGIEFLLRQLKRKDSKLKQQFIQRLARLPVPNKMKYRLLSLDTARNRSRRYIAVDILWAMGPAAESAVPALVARCKDELRTVRAKAPVQAHDNNVVSQEF